MEVKVVSKEKDSLELSIKGGDENILYPLVNELLKDENVSEAKFTLGHIQTEIPKLYIKMKEGKPQTALKKAVKHLSSQFESARKTFDKATK
jgi:DNA-directed RNA polymerase subunit L